MARFVDRYHAGHLLAARVFRFAAQADVVVVPGSPAALPVAETLAFELALPVVFPPTAALVAGRVVIVVEVGLRDADVGHALLARLRALAPSRLILALPVAAEGALAAVRAAADEVAVLDVLPSIDDVAGWYALDSAAVTDAPASPMRPPAAAFEREVPVPEAVLVPADHASLPGQLAVPRAPRSVVLLAHVPGDPLRIAHPPLLSALQQDGVATLDLALLSRGEVADAEGLRHGRCGIDVLTERILLATVWLERHPAVGGRPVGVIALEGAVAAALLAAARRPDLIETVVVVHGAPASAGHALALVRPPTLFVGSTDDAAGCAELEAAARGMGGEHRLLHLEATGAEAFALAAADPIVSWLETHLALSPLPMPRPFSGTLAPEVGGTGPTAAPP